MKPYTYLIKSKTTGEFYYGVKYSKDADPETFWRNYFTSSNTIKMMIDRDGKDSFETEIRRTFKTPEEALLWEQKVIRKIRNKEGCLNISLGGDAIKSHKNRCVIDSNGLNSYQRAGKKLSETLRNNPKMLKERNDKSHKTLSIIDEDGLTGYKRRGLKIIGENNPSKKPENKKKISDGMKKFIKENPERFAEIQEKSRLACLKKDENGLNVHDKHSKFMSENNPATGTSWYNNGEINKRFKEGEELKGFTKGRLKDFGGYKHKKVKCPHCGKEGSGGNMKRYHFENCKELNKL